jgi:GTP-binding protein EngB required for normal cell division
MGQVLTTVVTILAPLVIDLISKFKRPEAPPPQITQPPPVSEKSREELINEARTKLGLDCVNCYNFGIVGSSGSGKSSLVNAFRGVKPSSQYAAKVGEVETTMGLPQKYPCPDKEFVVLWDLPGGGTKANPAANYFNDKCCFAFDCLVIVTSNRFSEIDLEVARMAKEWSVPVFFVRNKSDADIESKSFNKGLSVTEAVEELKSEVSKDIRQQLREIGLADRSIYVVSTRAFYQPDRFTPIDESRLVQDVCTMAMQRRGAK